MKFAVSSEAPVTVATAVMRVRRERRREVRKSCFKVGGS
jgi:hypothetical protein